jgi:hypothetical protein
MSFAFGLLKIPAQEGPIRAVIDVLWVVVATAAAEQTGCGGGRDDGRNYPAPVPCPFAVEDGPTTSPVVPQPSRIAIILSVK